MRIEDALEPFDVASSVALMLSVIEREFRGPCRPLCRVVQMVTGSSQEKYAVCGRVKTVVIQEGSREV
jgi:hypothetical protein